LGIIANKKRTGKIFSLLVYFLGTQVHSESASQQVSKQDSESAGQQASESASQQASKSAKTASQQFSNLATKNRATRELKIKNDEKRNCETVKL
jgi:hypothetical protein